MANDIGVRLTVQDGRLVRDLRPVRAMTTDSKGPRMRFTRDAMLAVEDPNHPSRNKVQKIDTGVIFNGLRDAIDSLAPEDRADVLRRVGDYYYSGSGMKTTPRGTLATDGARQARDTATTVATMNAEAAAFWEPRNKACQGGRL